MDNPFLFSFFSVMLIVYISYLLIGKFSYRCGDDMGKNGQRLTRANRVGLVVGFIAATGLAILANFPVSIL